MTDDICTVRGCGRPTLARSWCAKHYQRWQKHGDPNYTPAPSRLRDGSKPTQFVTIGQQFGRWTVTGPEVRISSNRRAATVKCSCRRGTEKAVCFGDLFSGNSQSCGCLRGEMVAQRNRENNPSLTHGLSRHPLMDTWRNMRCRCENPLDKSWVNYGGRGISVYGPWRDLANFTAWVDEHLGPRPTGMSFDRIDNDGDYEPGNVRWATALQQRHNRRPLRRCPCGTDNPVKARFCFMCGTVLT